MTRTYIMLALVGFCALLTSCNRGDPVTSASLRDAEKRWSAQGVSSYQFKMTIRGDRIESGLFAVTVKDGEPTDITRDGQDVSTRDSFYTVPGLFEFMRDELDMAKEPGRYWGAQPGADLHQRASFHSERGYPERYLRAVMGTQQNVSIVIEEFITP